MAEPPTFAIPRTSSASAGATTFTILERIAHAHGAAFRHDAAMHELLTDFGGRGLRGVMSWYERNNGLLQQRQLRIHVRAVNDPTEAVLAWASEGQGRRGAVLAIAPEHYWPHDRIPPETSLGTHHLGLYGAGAALRVLDPWPGQVPEAQAVTSEIQTKLATAHRTEKFASLIWYWTGWS